MISGSYVIEKPASPYSVYAAPSAPRVHTNVVIGLWILGILGFLLSLAVFASLRQNSLWKLYKSANENGSGEFFRIDFRIADGGQRLVLEGWTADQCDRQCSTLAGNLAVQAAFGYNHFDQLRQFQIVIYNAVDLGPASLHRVVYAVDIDVAQWRQLAYLANLKNGDALVRNGELENAVQAYSYAIAVQPSAWEAYEQRAKIYARLHQSDLALQDLHRWRELAPTMKIDQIRGCIGCAQEYIES